MGGTIEQAKWRMSHGYTNPKDLEFGTVYVTEKVKRVVDMYKKNEHRIKFVVIGFVAVTVALILKYAAYNVDHVIDTATAITLDEDTYIPFQMSAEMIPSIEDTQSQKFPIKVSQVNWKMQTLNIVRARNRIWEYLDEANQECIHLRHFGVPYDIVVFRNITLINPEVTRESPQQKKIKEMSLDGTVNRKSRPMSLDVAYYDEALTYQKTTLWGSQSYCFSHYEF